MQGRRNGLKSTGANQKKDQFFAHKHKQIPFFPKVLGTKVAGAMVKVFNMRLSIVYSIVANLKNIFNL